MTQIEALITKLREKEAQTKSLTTILESLNLSFEGMLEQFNHTLEIETLTSSVQTMNTIDTHLKGIEARLKMIEMRQEEQFGGINDKLEQYLASNTCYSNLALEGDEGLYIIASNRQEVWCYDAETGNKLKQFTSEEALTSLMIYHHKLFVKTSTGTVIETSSKETLLQHQKDVKVCKLGIAALDEMDQLWFYHHHDKAPRIIVRQVKGFELINERYLMYRHENGKDYLGDLEGIVKQNHEAARFIELSE